MSLHCNSARDKDFEATPVSLYPQGDALFSPSTCLGRKTVLQCCIILAINSRKLCVTLTYSGKLLWGEDCQEVRAPWLVTVQLNASSVLKGFCVFWKGDRSYTEEKLFPLAVATLNWANLKSWRVCICVYLLWQGIVTLQFTHSCTWNKKKKNIPSVPSPGTCAAIYIYCHSCSFVARVNPGS